MSSFRDPLFVKVLDDGKNYELLQSFHYFRETNNNEIIQVQKGFITDFASVPRIFWSIFPPFGRYTKCAVLHDRLCVAFNNKQTWQEVVLINDDMKATTDLSKKVKRKEADKIFLESMKAIKVGKFTRTCLYLSVRLYAIFKYGLNS